MADKYIFDAGGDACPICAGMHGQVFETAPSLPHDGCQCQVIPLDDEHGCPSYQASLAGINFEYDYATNVMTIHYGFEVTVTCCDGTDISESVDYEDVVRSDDAGEIEETNVDLDVEVEALAAELAMQCAPGVDE